MGFRNVVRASLPVALVLLAPSNHAAAQQLFRGVLTAGTRAPASTDRSRTITRAALPALPSNLEFPESLRPLMDRMWRHSPTFRRQCARLADAGDLTIVLYPGQLPERKKNVAGALTQIQTRKGQRTRADVLLGYRDLERHIAHEVEHIIERLDGVYVEHLAARSMRGVERVGEMFETARAREIGVLVWREVQKALSSRSGNLQAPDKTLSGS